MRSGCLLLLLLVNLSSCDAQPIQFEAPDIDGPDAAENTKFTTEALAEVGPIGPRPAGLVDSTLSRDLTGYAFEGDVDLKWLESLIDAIEQARKALPPAANRVNLLEMLPAHIDPRIVDLGFDQLRISVTLPGGYSSCKFQIILYYEDIQELEVTCSWSNATPEGVDAVLRNSLGPGFLISRKDRQIEGRAHFVFPRMKAQAAERLSNELGPMIQAKVPEDLEDAFEMLMSPYVEHTVGLECGYGAHPPLARLAASKLVNAERVDLLRNVLHGPNPESRVYAAWGLTRLEALTESDRKTVEKLRHIDIRLQACYGCMVVDQPNAEVWTNFDRQLW